MKPPARPQAPPAARVPPVPAARIPIQRRPEPLAFAPALDPIDETKYPGTPDGDVAVELNQIQAWFRARMADEAKRFKSATDGGYYFVACFDSSEQCEAFLASVGMGMGGNSGATGDLYIDGRAMADRLAIALPASPPAIPRAPRIDPVWAGMVRKPGG